MAMSKIWTVMAAVSLIFAVITGRINELGASVLEGANSAVDLCLTMGAAVCLWSGVMEVMQRAGLSEKLSRLMRPVLRKLFPSSAENSTIMETISGNVSANLLGLGNAATPLGMKACELMGRNSGGVATDDMCMLVVLNTASIQLLPTTIAAVRSSAGCASPFDILPAVWVTSVVALAAGLGSAFILRRRIK